MKDNVKQATHALYEESGLAKASTLSNKELAKAIENAFNMTAKNGLDQQIAIVKIMEFMDALPNDYDFIKKGKLEFGMGIQNIAARLISSTSYDPETAQWVPNTYKTIEKVQSISTNKIQRMMHNDYTPDKLREYVRNGESFAKLIELENSVVNRSKQVEEREIVRYLLGIDNGILPDDFKKELDVIKPNFKVNEITFNAKDIKDGIAQITNWVNKVQKNPSNKYNLCGKEDNGEYKIFINGNNTNVKALTNTWTKNEMILIMSTEFANKLKIETANIYHPDFWKEFYSNFGKVIEDTFESNQDGSFDFYLWSPNVLEMRDIYDEYTLTYYPDAMRNRSLATYSYNFNILPFANGVKIKLNITK